MIFKKFTLLFFYIILNLTNSLFAQSDLILKEEINQALIEEGLTGAVWSIVDAEGKITFDAAGINNKETGRRLIATDKVHVGSITKTLIATGILRLATENLLGINESIKKYLPELTFDNQWEAAHPITIRHLLDHTSGLTDMRIWQMFSENAKANTPLELAFKKNPKVLKVYAQPGSIFSYSNMGYALLGMIIESVTAENYENYLDKNLLLPLGMTNSTFQFVSQVGHNADTTLAFGHLDNQIVYPALPMYLRPAGQFTTTAYDMAVFAQFLMSDGTINGKEFISHSYLMQMGQSQNTISKQNKLVAGYGLGAMTRDRHGYIGLAHSGNIVGYHAMLYWFPNEKKAFFISHNMDSETANYERFNETLINYLKLNKPVNKTEAISTKGLEEWSGYYIPVFSKVEPFAYLDILSSFTKVTTHADFVNVAPFQKPNRKLFRVSENLLIADAKTESSQLFYKNSVGKHFITDGFSSHKKISGYYLLAHWLSFVLGCIGLVYVLISGIFQVVKAKRNIFKNPIWSSFLAILLLLTPIPFFISQSFVALGDFTTASLLLFISTCLLPLGFLYSFVQYLKRGLSSLKNKLNFVAIIFSLQWIVVLLTWGLIPFRLWI